MLHNYLSVPATTPKSKTKWPNASQLLVCPRNHANISTFRWNSNDIYVDDTGKEHIVYEGFSNNGVGAVVAHEGRRLLYFSYAQTAFIAPAELSASVFNRCSFSSKEDAQSFIDRVQLSAIQKAGKYVSDWKTKVDAENDRILWENLDVENGIVIRLMKGFGLVNQPHAPEVETYSEIQCK